MRNTEKRSRKSGPNRRNRRFQSKFRPGGKRRTEGHAHSRPGRTERIRDHAKPSRPKAPSLPRESVSLEGAFGTLIQELQQAINAAGYTTSTPVQSASIPPQIEGKDLLGTAQTGTGKTAAFTLPLLQKLSSDQAPPRSRRPRALILAPTRELAAQIGDSIKTYGRFLNVSHTVIFGGVGQRPQERAMNNGVDIVVATPGRLLDLMNQGFVQLDAIDTLILDEADRMLDMGFIPDVKRILAAIPDRRQTAFFSATLPKEVVSLADSMLTDPVRITINPEAPTVEKICQRVLYVNREDKDKLLLSILQEQGVERVIVFTQMKHVANRVSDRLQKFGIPAAPIHGNRSQAARTRALTGFKNGRVRVLVATDIAARGIDVDGISHVINYDLPPEAETYVHRIGRTARAGTDGHAWSFCTAQERGALKGIERLIKKPVPIHTEHDFHSEQALVSVTSPSPQRGHRHRPPGGRRGSRGKSFASGGRRFGRRSRGR